MTQTLDLKKMGVAEMQDLELQETDGGITSFGWWLAQQIVSSWDDIKKGTVDGWNSVHYN